MGNQGFLLRKVTLDKTLNQLNFFLKGAFMILLMYLINGWLIEKNLQIKDVQMVVGLYVLVFVVFFFLKKRKNSLSENQIMHDLKNYFDVQKFSDVEYLDKKLIQEIKQQRKFVANNGQIVGTQHFLLFDLTDGQFLLIPIKKNNGSATRKGQSIFLYQHTNRGKNGKNIFQEKKRGE
jgi:Ca2+/Na+ antiporter